jgi:nucleoside-diphosphate-sugar epimerase
MRVLVTGASGFIGGALIARLAREPDLTVVGSERRDAPPRERLAAHTYFSDLTADSDWSEAVSGVNVVVHTAERVHMMRDASADPLDEFRRVNVAGTLSLARDAARAGVARFIFVSSIKVNGEGLEDGGSLTPADRPRPADPYGQSKPEAETGLRQLCEITGMELVIVRPVLVYGPGVGGNFLTLMSWVRRGVPLPFGAVQNVRSLVALENLVDLLNVCVSHENATNQVFLVSDGEDVSTPELLRRVALSMGCTIRLISLPVRALTLASSVVGQSDSVRRLCGSLQIDMSRTREKLDWAPPVSMQEALDRTVPYFLRQQG